jgi:acyl-coenzyme A thioesterase PaaI-like protein
LYVWKQDKMYPARPRTTNSLGTARDGTLACTARPVHLGRMTHVWAATVVRKDDQKTIALFRCTQIILYPTR